MTNATYLLKKMSETEHHRMTQQYYYSCIMCSQYTITVGSQIKFYLDSRAISLANKPTQFPPPPLLVSTDMQQDTLPPLYQTYVCGYAQPQNSWHALWRLSMPHIQRSSFAAFTSTRSSAVTSPAPRSMTQISLCSSRQRRQIASALIYMSAYTYMKSSFPNRNKRHSKRK